MNGTSILVGIALVLLALLLGKVGRDYWRTYTARQVAEREARRMQLKSDIIATIRRERNAQE